MGKSTCSQFARDAGIPVFDSDAVVHDLYRQDGAAVGPLRSRFGDDILNEQGGIDRPALGKHVLNQPDAMADLEGIVHPLVQQVKRKTQLSVFVVVVLVLFQKVMLAWIVPGSGSVITIIPELDS